MYGLCIRSEVRGSTRWFVLGAIALVVLALLAWLSFGEDPHPAGEIRVEPTMPVEPTTPEGGAVVLEGTGAPDTPVVAVKVMLKVRLRGESGKLTPGVLTVSGLGEGGSVELESETGSFELPVNVREVSNCTFRATSPDHLWVSSTKSSPVAPDVDTLVTLKLTHRRIYGYVRGEAGQGGISGASVSCAVDERAEVLEGAAQTAPDGSFELLVKRGAFSPELRVVVTHRRWHPGAAAVPLQDRAVEVTMRPRAIFSGRVRTGDGASSVDATVRVQVVWRGFENKPTRARADPWISRSGWVEMQSRKTGEYVLRFDIDLEVGEDGAFSTALPFTGTVTAVARLSGYTIGQSLPIDVGEGESRAPDIILTRIPTEASRLRIVDAEGRPLRGIKVWFQDDVVGLERRTLFQSKTDANGYVDAGALPVGLRVGVVVDSDTRDKAADRIAPGAKRFYSWLVGSSDQVQVR